MITNISELPDALLMRSDGTEICAVEEGRDVWGDLYCEAITPDEIGRDPTASYFWSVYLHQKRGGVECIADFHTVQEALAYAEIVDTLLQSVSDQTVNQ